MNQIAHPTRNFPRLFAMSFTLASLLLASASVSLSSELFEENANDQVLLKIRGGQFKSLTPLSPQATGRTLIDVYSGEPTCIQLHSEDYVYTVTQRDLGVAVVVLPHADARMQLVLPRGISTLNIVQGCGKPTPSDSHVVHLNSVPRSGKIQSR